MSQVSGVHCMSQVPAAHCMSQVSAAHCMSQVSSAHCMSQVPAAHCMSQVSAAHCMSQVFCVILLTTAPDVSCTGTQPSLGPRPLLSGGCTTSAGDAMHPALSMGLGLKLHPACLHSPCFLPAWSVRSIQTCRFRECSAQPITKLTLGSLTTASWNGFAHFISN